MVLKLYGYLFLDTRSIYKSKFQKLRSKTEDTSWSYRRMLDWIDSASVRRTIVPRYHLATNPVCLTWHPHGRWAGDSAPFCLAQPNPPTAYPWLKYPADYFQLSYAVHHGTIPIQIHFRHNFLVNCSAFFERDKTTCEVKTRAKRETQARSYATTRQRLVRSARCAPVTILRAHISATATATGYHLPPAPCPPSVFLDPRIAQRLSRSRSRLVAASPFPRAAAEHHPDIRWPSNGGGGRGPGAADAGGGLRLRPAPGRPTVAHREAESRWTGGSCGCRAGSRVQACRTAPCEEIIRRCFFTLHILWSYWLDSAFFVFLSNLLRFRFVLIESKLYLDSP